MKTLADSNPGADLSRWLITVGLAALALRLWLAISFPVTGDEAFFYWWGVYPDWGYSDHPPMVGWWIALMRWLLADATWAIRLPVVLLPLALGGALYWALAPLNKVRAGWAALLLWLAPLNWLNMLITTDTPLIFWAVLSAACMIRAEQRERMDRAAYRLYLLSGLFLGCAFLSKYFSVLLGLAYLAYILSFRRERWPGLLGLVLCALPGPAINIAWNMHHGWANIMFNVYNRNEDAVFAWTQPALYLLSLAYLMTPAVVWLAFKHRAVLWQACRIHRLLTMLVTVPLLGFGLLSLKKVIGLHWVLAFYPFGFALLALALPLAALKTCAQGMAAFTGLHVALVIAMSLSHLAQWQDTRIYHSIVRSYETDELLKQIAQPDTVLMADAYTPASIYGFARRQYMPVFGPGKFHSRQDDQLVDFSVYAGKTIRIITSAVPNMADYQPYFEAVRLLQFEQSGAKFDVVEGQGFNAPAYRQGVLGTIFARYYNIPDWLPMRDCPFCVRFCGAVQCPR